MIRAVATLAAFLFAAQSSSTQSNDGVQRLLDRYAAGWARGEVVREGDTTPAVGDARLDPEGDDWVVFAIEGDIRLFKRHDLRLEARLPAAINTREREFDPSLIRTHEGQYALLWARGTSSTHARRFVAFSGDLVRWTTAERLVFEQPLGELSYTYGLAEPLERTHNIVRVQSGYAMLLAQGFIRFADDMRRWGPPLKMLRQDLWRNRLLAGTDGTIWAVFETSSDERKPYTDDDWLYGFFAIDGKPIRHSTELRVARSVDGRAWQDVGGLAVPGQPSGVWVFRADADNIGIAAGFNNLYVRWFGASPIGQMWEVDADLQLFNQSDSAEFFVRNGTLTSVRPLVDPWQQKRILFTTTTTWKPGR